MKDATYVHPLTALGKRVMDISLAFSGLLLTLSLYPVIALAIKLDSPGSVFYRQLRIGFQRDDCICLFMMIKFRTMSPNAKSESKVTASGRFLRKTHLDELPLLWNVLLGDMSIVGPKPERPGTSCQRESNIPFYTERTYDVTPGIIGLAQLHLGNDKTIDDTRNKVAYDHAYALSLNHPLDWLKMDTSILFKAMMVMMTGRIN